MNLSQKRLCSSSNIFPVRLSEVGTALLGWHSPAQPSKKIWVKDRRNWLFCHLIFTHSNDFVTMIDISYMRNHRHRSFPYLVFHKEADRQGQGDRLSECFPLSGLSHILPTYGWEEGWGGDILSRSSENTWDLNSNSHSAPRWLCNFFSLWVYYFLP